MSSTTGTHIQSALLVLLVLLATFNAGAFFYLRPPIMARQSSSEGRNGYPNSLPIDLTQTFQYSYTEHLDYFALSEDPKSIAAWDSLVPPGYGFVNLGPNRQRFAVSMFHQVHCLIQIRRALHQGSEHPHLAHCLNYMMQMVLCAADVTLEPEIEPTIINHGVPKTSPSNATHTCRDWTKVYEYMEELYWS